MIARLVRVLMCGLVLLASARVGAVEPTAAPRGEAVSLRLRMQPGEAWLVSFDAKQDVTLTSGAERQAFTERTVLDYVWQVVAVEPSGTATVELTYDYVRVETTQDGKTTRVESDAAEDAAQTPQEKAVRALAGQKLRLRFGIDGRVLDVEGTQKILDAVGAQLGGLDAKTRTEVTDNLRARISEQALRPMFEGITAIYPENAVAAGDRWTRRARTPGETPVTTETLYTLRERRDGTAFVDVLASITNDTAADPDHEVLGKQKGTLEIDERSGWVKRMSLEQTVIETIAKPEPGQGTRATGKITMTARPR